MCTSFNLYLPRFAVIRIVYTVQCLFHFVAWRTNIHFPKTTQNSSRNSSSNLATLRGWWSQLGRFISRCASSFLFFYVSLVVTWRLLRCMWHYWFLHKAKTSRATSSTTIYISFLDGTDKRVHCYIPFGYTYYYWPISITHLDFACEHANNRVRHQSIC